MLPEMVLKDEAVTTVCFLPLLVVGYIFLEGFGHFQLIALVGAELGQGSIRIKLLGEVAHNGCDHKDEAVAGVELLGDGCPEGVDVDDDDDPGIEAGGGQGRVDLVEKHDVEIGWAMLFALVALAVVVVIVGEPDVQVVDILMLRGIVDDVVADLLSRRAVSHTNLGIEGLIAVERTLAVHKGEILHHVIREFIAVDLTPAVVGADAEGIDGEAVTAVVEDDAALFHFALKLDRPLCDLLGADGLGGAKLVVAVMVIIAVVKGFRVLELYHKGVESDLWHKLDKVKEHML